MKINIVKCKRGRLILKEYIKANYGIIFSGIYVIFLTIMAIFFSDKIYVPIHDNLDSNVVWEKMFYDNNMWIDRDSPIPFLGGVSRDILTNGYSIYSLLDWFLSIPVAYAVKYILHVILSVIGFYLIAKILNKYTSFYADVNIFTLCGCIYSMVGVWPPAYIGFSLLPLWVYTFGKIYFSGSYKYFLLIPILAYNTSFPLLGIFILFYMILVGVLLIFKDKKMNIPFMLAILLSILVFSYADIAHIVKGVNGFENTIKTLVAEADYDQGVMYCFVKFIKVVLGKDIDLAYHAGFFSFRYFILPVVYVAFILRVLSSKYRNRLDIFLVLFSMLIVNDFAFAFDDCYLRNIIGGLSGFSFSRFMWLSPFLAICCLSCICSYLCHIEKRKISIVIISLSMISIITSGFFRYDRGIEHYNILNINYVKYICKNEIGYSNHRIWNEFYQEELFNKIKKEIGYSGEWSVGFFLDPAVLQYNSIRTLDGYYSNYSLEYHDKWEKLIKPSWEIDEIHKEYWHKSAGIRAYVYSPGWTKVNDKIIYDEYPMYIDQNVFCELQGKYIFSRVKISNAHDLGLDIIGKWSKDDYNIYVYINKDIT